MTKSNDVFFCSVCNKELSPYLNQIYTRCRCWIPVPKDAKIWCQTCWCEMKKQEEWEKNDLRQSEIDVYGKVGGNQ